MKKQYGFNLIELMIVVAIIGIIAAIAYPSYVEQMRTTRRADCSGALVGFGNSMERFFTMNSTYLGAGTNNANADGPPAIFPVSCPVDGGTPTYLLTIQPTPTVSTYILQAAPTGIQANDKCGTLTINNRGVKGITGAAAGLTPGDCW